MTDELELKFDALAVGAFKSVGRPVARREDLRLITGKGRFTDDFNEPGQVVAVLVRSPYPHARINRIDSDTAKQMPGVLAIYTGEDCRADGLGIISHSPVPSTRSDLKLTAPGGGAIFEGPHALLPVDKARHVGEGIAMVVAESHRQALDAAEHVRVDYEPLPWVADSAVAIRDGAPTVWDEVPNNVCVDTRFGDTAATDAAFASAAHVIEMEFPIQRVTATPLEPRAALGQYDEASGRYTLNAGSNGAVTHKRQIAGALNVDPENIRVLCFDVGGNFGTKNRVYVEFGLVLWAARKIGRPVKFLATRSESFLSDYQGRDLLTRVELALDADGTFLAYRASNLSNVGARIVSLSPLGKGAPLVTGSYRIPAAEVRAWAAFTTTTPTQAYRSSGRPEVIHALERIIDTAAHRLGFDPIALRRKNLVSSEEMPYTNAFGITYDSGDYIKSMDIALRLADWDGFEARALAVRERGLRLGRGFANYVESSIGAPRERVDMTISPAGRVEVVVGTQPTGQGHETSFAQVTADLLGIDANAVDIVYGDTDIVAEGGGSHSGRSMRHASTAIYGAIEKLKVYAIELAADVWGIETQAIGYGDGRFVETGGARRFDWFELAALEAERAGGGDQRGLRISHSHEMHTPVFPNGCAACEVEVDTETGFVRITKYVAVDDVGRVINPLIVDGQTHGSIATGAGQALWEQCYTDPDSGQPLSGSFMDYGIPRADEMPSFITAFNEVPSPTNPLGVKSGGEGPTTAALAVIINAIVDALRDLGVDDIPMPATPFQVWQSIRDAQG
ncbi:MAG: xanthine dehydrogenase family protein molybdopterin-binding subunit [Gammaproteobacteria bacterium]|nr:xanthine dehydrogenase family protein molybdopterin-binding subunit [Gammaproteobacteria bacterium]MDH3508510.1 xanthine dehydrogenase family protein molybdopterin-binding subunit [Gammaproteobacteria bacterium]